MNILITGAWRNCDCNIEKIKHMGHNVAFMQRENDSLPCEYDWVDAVICNSLFLFHPIEKFVNLKYIQLTSAGYDRVPLDYVKKHNIDIYNARGVYSIPRAEYAVASALQLYKNFTFFHDNQKNKLWEKDRSLQELYGKTVCVVGCGSVGTECAKRFKAFGCKTIGVDISFKVDNAFDKIVLLEALDMVISQTDIVILTLPLTDETYHIFNKERFSFLKSDVILINISRGAVVDTQALVEFFSNDRPQATAVLDVFEDEPLPQSSVLWEMKNIFITPHNSFIGDANNERLADLILSNLSQI